MDMQNNDLTEPNNEFDGPMETIRFPDNNDFPDGFSAIQPAGRGTFAEIWKVRERATGNVFALKRLLPQFVDDEGARRLLLNEATAGHAVAGQHVVRVMQSNHNLSPPFNLLEWLDGGTLGEQLESGQSLSIGSIIWVARQCAQGLSDLARAGYSHGDVKPDNIFLETGGAAKLIDLGFAEPIGEPPSLGQVRCITGTPEYMAPESCLRGTVNSQLRDMYSLGVVIFRLLAGQLPFEAATVEQVLRLHGSARPPALGELCPSAPDDLVNLVERLLAKQPVRRPQSFSSLIRELTALELETLHARFAA
jgi:eukaryotic-like serine/threonine-protein kinase